HPREVWVRGPRCLLFLRSVDELHGDHLSADRFDGLVAGTGQGCQWRVLCHHHGYPIR
ncbi:urea-proton symporter DUR3, partial [Biomphalaria glabrata]